MAEKIVIEPINAKSFAQFGSVISAQGRPSFLINQDTCERYHDLARAQTSSQYDHVSMSIARSQAFSLPYTLGLMERHPLGSQAFVPMGDVDLLVVVAPDDNGKPGKPQAFLCPPGHGVNYYRNTWHGVLTPLEKQVDFLIVDRIGSGDNLEEHTFDEPYSINKA